MPSDQSQVDGLGGHTPPGPSGWTPQRSSARFRLSVACLAVITIGLTAGAVWTFSSGKPEGGVLLAAVAVYLGHLLGLMFRARWPRRRPGAPATLVADPRATTKAVRFAYSGWLYYWGTAFLVLTALPALLLSAAFAMSRTIVGVAAAMLIGTLGLFIVWYLVTMLRLAPGEVTLSPAGVFHSSLTHLHFVPWYAVVGVTARWWDTPILTVEAHPSDDTGVRRHMGRLGTSDLQYLPIMVIRAQWLATNPVLLYHALSFYHAHPDLRAELATPEAVERINSGQAMTREQQ